MIVLMKFDLWSKGVETAAHVPFNRCHCFSV